MTAIAIHEVMLDKAPADAGLLSAVSSFYAAPPGAARLLTSLVGADEGKTPDPIIVDRQPVSGDVSLVVRIAARIETDLADLAAHLAGALKCKALYRAGPGADGFMLVGPDGAPKKVKIIESESEDADAGEIRIKELAKSA